MAGLGLTRTEPCRSNNDVLNDNEPIDNRASLAILGGSPLLRPEEIKSVGRPDLPGYPLACGSVRLGARRQLRRCRDVHRLGVPDRCFVRGGQSLRSEHHRIPRRRGNRFHRRPLVPHRTLPTSDRNLVGIGPEPATPCPVPRHSRTDDGRGTSWRFPACRVVDPPDSYQGDRLARLKPDRQWSNHQDRLAGEVAVVEVGLPRRHGSLQDGASRPSRTARCDVTPETRSDGLPTGPTS